MLTAAEVRSFRFSPSGVFRAGYDTDDVDAWLEMVIRTLRAYEGEADGTVELLAEDVHEVSFETAHGRSAYATEEVDAAISAIAAALAEHESAA